MCSPSPRAWSLTARRRIEAFQSQEYWLLDARLNCGAEDAVFTARFHGKGDKKQELRSKDEVDEVINAVQAQPFTVSGVKRGEKQKSPAPPFITSTLQQEALAPPEHDPRAAPCPSPSSSTRALR